MTRSPKSVNSRFSYNKQVLKASTRLLLADSVSVFAQRSVLHMFTRRLGWVLSLSL